MKFSLIIFFFILACCSSCKKSETCIYTKATITDKARGSCGGWGIVVNGIIYPSLNIPDQFRKKGLKVCTEYNLYFDSRDCPAPCCGGYYADIKSMK